MKKILFVILTIIFLTNFIFSGNFAYSYSAYSYSTECPANQKLVMGSCYDIPKYPQDDDFNTVYDSANKFRDVGDFEIALELIEKAIQLNDVNQQGAFFEKANILAKMARHSEALEAFLIYEKLVHKTDVLHTLDYKEALLLYHLGDYSKAEKRLIEEMLYMEDNMPEGVNKKLFLMSATFLLVMIEEKLGNEELTNMAYEKFRTYSSTPLDCAKVGTLLDSGGYVEAMDILNTTDEIECPAGTVSDLKKLAQERINKYVKCGKGTILRDGFCVPEPVHEPEPEPICGPGTVLKNGVCVVEAQGNGGGCLIATATYGSELAPQVQMLREIRDNSLLQTQSGQSFMQGFNQFYYSFSPTIADYERQNPIFKEAVKVTITPLLASLSLLNYVDLDSEESVLGYGIGIILMNVGMYFVAPVMVIHRIKKILNS